MNRFSIFAISIFSCINTFAQWMKPSEPAAMPTISIYTECYLYNKEAGGFLTGANEWGTRASVSEDHGWKITLDIISDNNNWDGESYYIISDIENGDKKGFKGYMFLDGINDIYLDKDKNENDNNVFTFIRQADKTYKIGVSNWNKDFKKDDYPYSFLGCKYGKNDTRVYLCNTDTTNMEYEHDSIQTSWYIVSPSEYNKYIENITRYKAAIKLGETLEEARELEGIDSELMYWAEFYYGFSYSEIEDLISYNESLRQAIKDIKLGNENISINNPIEVLAIDKTVEQTFANADTTGWTMNTNADNKQATNGNAAKDYEVTGNHLENWKAEAIGTGTIWAKITNIPNGVYRLETLAFTDDSTSTLIFAGNDTAFVKTSMIDVDNPTKVMTIVSNNELTFGMKLENSNATWVGMDNVNLFYLGNKDEAYRYLADSYIAKNKDFESLVDNSIIPFYCKQSYKTYLDAVNKLKESDNAEDITNNLIRYKESINIMEQSIVAYDDFVKSYVNAGMWLTTQTFDNDKIKLLDEYINGTNDVLGFNGNGNATHILEFYDLNITEIIEEKAYLDKLYDDAFASLVNEGEDCTKLIKNANFSENNGWISAVGPTWPTGNTELFPVMEVWNMVCDVYQEMTNLKNGLYEMNIQCAFRPGEEYNEENISKANADIYINSYKKSIPCANIRSASEASQQFKEGQYNVKVYGLVTDGTMRIGISNRLRSVEGCVLWAGGATLKYHGKNTEKLSEAISNTLTYAEEVYNNSVCGLAEKEVLEYAIKFAGKEDDPFEELINLKNCIDAVEEGAALYKQIESIILLLNKTLDESKADENTIATLREIGYNASNLWSRKELSNIKAKEYIAKIYEAIVIAKRYGYKEGTRSNPVNYSDLIINNNFDPKEGSKDENTINGWKTTSMNGYKLNTVSYNRSEYELNQTIYGLKKGTYKITVNGYYRAGYAQEDEMLFNDTIDSHLAILYVTTPQDRYSTPLMNLSEGATEKLECTGDYVRLSNSLYVPNSSSSSVEYFNKGYYFNELEFELKSYGPITIGISKKGIFANDYSVIGEWELWNMGIVNDDMSTVSIDNTISNNCTEEVFSVNGTRIAKPTNGINIVRMSDGSVKKIIK